VNVVRPGLIILLLCVIQANAIAEESHPLSFVQADRIEYQEYDDEWLWDLQGWVGGDERKLWWKTEGELHSDNVAGAELQLLYSKAVSPFFDLQIGLRQDLEPDPNRAFAVVGLQGLAPQWFEIDAAAFLSDDGDLSARFEAEYDLYLTQRLVLQPRFEVNAGASDVAELGLGSGLRTTALDLRLRYEFRRKFAPYLGVSWRKSYGDTGDAFVAAGSDDDLVTFVAGARFWF
jgi:copper resistance protein B